MKKLGYHADFPFLKAKSLIGFEEGALFRHKKSPVSLQEILL